MHPEENRLHMMWMALLCHLPLKEKNHFFPGTKISKFLLKIDHSMSINRTFKAILVNVKKVDTRSAQLTTFHFFFNLPSINNSVGKCLTLYSLTSVFIFSIVFSMHFQRC